MPTVQVNDLNTLAVYVSDPERAKAFYVEQLGFEPCDQMSPGLLLKAGEVTLYLEGGRKPRSTPAFSESEVSFCLQTLASGVKEAHEKLKAAGVSVVEEYQEFAPTFAMFRIADPDGNVIEFAGKP